MIYQGDCLDILPTIEAKSIQCCVTSPPYYGLRDYGVDGQIGLEATPGTYVEKLVAVFKEVRRVLADDGTLWLNLGDSYNGSGGPGSQYDTKSANSYKGVFKKYNNPNRNISTLKPKDLIGIPWRVAFALQADGWYLRQDIIWHKPNPMPESVRDRCTRAHEYIFLLSKSPKYYFDSEALREPGVYPAGTKAAKGSTKRSQQVGVSARPPEYKVYDGFRNKRSVWTVTTKPFKGAHFATFPEEIPRTCILAGSKKGDTILDPFSGAGTTGVVARKLGREYIGIELNPRYTKLAEDRIWNVQPLFAGVNP